MCGIAGVLDRSGTPVAELAASVAAMADRVRHRGPDDHGSWVEPTGRVALAHRRLAVIDRSPTGHQPMRSASGRYVISFNGEVYGFAALRRELRAVGSRFRGRSDTEVLLAAIDLWGIDRALQRCNGMFAFALWDRDRSELHLVRDRIGEKPLYYAWSGRVLLFASELGALRGHPRFVPRLDRDALAAYLQFSYVPAPLTIYREARKLPAGCILTVTGTDNGATGRLRPYWSFPEMLDRAAQDPLQIDGDTLDELDRRIRAAVRDRMAADVPLGCFLSGGVDSSLVVAAAQAESDRPVRTYTVAFEEASHNEAVQAAAVARHLGTDHTELQLSHRDALAVVPRLADVYDEPFADPSQLPTVAMTASARRHVTVCLSGDGGDEVFGGYHRYTHSPEVWRRLRRLPHPVRRALAGALLVPSHRTWSALLDGGVTRYVRNPADKVEKLARLMRARDERELHRAIVSHWPEPAALVAGARAPDLVATPTASTSLVERLMAADTISELPDCMLVKIDRASMAVALEVRVPLLDPALVAFAWRLPVEARVRDRQGKWALREVLGRYVPRELTDRPKMGFDPPIAAWLRGPLRPWAEELLSVADRDCPVALGPVRARWHEHLRGRRNWDYHLWIVLAFLAWQDRNRVSI